MVSALLLGCERWRHFDIFVNEILRRVHDEGFWSECEELLFLHLLLLFLLVCFVTQSWQFCNDIDLAQIS